jgi:subfamily B ATP-binding cassette protein MsbA
MELKFKNNFWGYFQFYYKILKSRFVVSLVLSVAVSFLDGIGLSMFMPLLQAVGDDGSSISGGKHTMGQLHYFTAFLNSLGIGLTLYSILGVLTFLFISKGVMKFFQQYYMVKMRQEFMRTVQLILTDKLQELSFRGFVKLDAGRVQNTLTTEVTRLRTGMTHYLTSFQSVVMLLTYMFLAFAANWKFAVLVSVGAVASNIIFKRIFSLTKKASISLSGKGDQFNSYILQAVHYFKYLKSTNYFRFYTGKLRGVIGETEALNKKIGFYQAITTSVREPVLIVIVSLVIIIQIQWIGSNLSTILLSLLLFYRALLFLLSLQASWQSYIQNIGAMNAIAELSSDMGSLKEDNSGSKQFAFNKEIELRSISLNYGDRNILNNVNLLIPKNKMIALVGESGSGKTTLANIITTILNPTQGNLLADGMPITQFDLNSYRNKIGYISQEPVIFNDTIYNNVTFWSEPTEANLERFKKTIELTSLNDFLSQLPDKEHTKLGDHGILISGGQKQRISIARELFKNVELLIMDEATSSLDSETENIIQNNIDSMHGKYTMIIIAHRLSTIRNADLIYLLDKGSIIASGNFEAMCAQSIRFKRMVELQEF